MTKKFLIIKTGSTIAPLLATNVDFENWFAQGMGLSLGDVMVSSIHLNHALPALDAVAGIVITGSAAYVTDEEPWNFTGAEYLRAAHSLGIPILGVCYGHQLLAWAFGGEVYFNPGGREIGTVDIRLTPAAETDSLLNGLPRRFSAQVSHQQSVKRLPDQAVLLAENDFEPHHAFRLGDRTWGVQFHPEFSAGVMQAYLRDRFDAIADEGLEPDKLLNAVEETPECATLLRGFVQLANS